MQEMAGEQGAAYIPMPKGRGFTPHFGKSKNPTDSARPGCVGCLLPRGVNVNPVPRTYTIVMYTGM